MPERNPIRILIADSAYLVREGIKSVVADQENMTVIGEALNQEELLEMVSTLRPELVILDYHSSDAFSVEGVGELLEDHPEPAALVISSNLKREDVLRVLEFGVKGFLLKECDREEILGAIRAVAKGDKFFCSKVLDIILERQNGKRFPTSSDCAPTRLTSREIEIVKLMANGYPTQEIADQLSVSVHTIYTHRKNIMRKLGANSATEVILYAIQTSLVSA